MSLKIFPGKSSVLFTLFCFTLLIFPISTFTEPSTGNLMGFVYGKDGKTPLRDATVLLRGVETEEVYRSEPTSKTGDYRISDIEAGTYVVGLKVKEDTYNVDGCVMVARGKTDTLSISLELPPEPAGTPQAGGEGWCCMDGKVYKSTEEECSNVGGKFFFTKKKARESCGLPTPFFKKPGGIAVLIVGTAAVGFGIYKLLKKKEDKEISPTER